MRSMSDTIIYHNPKCGTSRNTLALIRNAGIEPQVILYLETPPSRAQLVQLIADCGLSVREVLRAKGDLYDELGLADPKWTDDELLDFMVAHPILINRPIVVTPKGTRPVPPVREGARHPAPGSAGALHQRRRRSGDRCGRPTPCLSRPSPCPTCLRSRSNTSMCPTRRVCTRQRLPRTPRASCCSTARCASARSAAC
jgi:arsenate reductase